jgi:hypothetical protein
VHRGGSVQFLTRMQPLFMQLSRHQADP